MGGTPCPTAPSGRDACPPQNLVGVTPVPHSTWWGSHLSPTAPSRRHTCPPQHLAGVTPILHSTWRASHLSPTHLAGVTPAPHTPGHAPHTLAALTTQLPGMKGRPREHRVITSPSRHKRLKTTLKDQNNDVIRPAFSLVAYRAAVPPLVDAHQP